jgi:Flp pilus assembly protein TadB
MRFGLPIFILLLGYFVYLTWIEIARDENGTTRREGLPTSGALSRMAGQISQTTSVKAASKSPLLNAVREKVVASGAFSGSFESYLSAQFAAFILGGAILVLCATGAFQGPMRIASLFVGIGVSFWPYNTATKNAGKRAERTAADLPEFVEMLQIPLASGMSVEQALRFTCRFTDGPVRAEVQWLLDTLQARTMNDAEAFVEAGRRLGTAEATAFFSTLGQAHIEGTRVSETLQRQAESLRNQYHQIRRARVKKMPLTLIVAFAVHFLPFLFVLVLVPLMIGLQGVG